jgi:hypothetical protein
MYAKWQGRKRINKSCCKVFEGHGQQCNSNSRVVIVGGRRCAVLVLAENH